MGGVSEESSDALGTATGGSFIEQPKNNRAGRRIAKSILHILFIVSPHFSFDTPAALREGIPDCIGAALRRFCCILPCRNFS